MHACYNFKQSRDVYIPFLWWIRKIKVGVLVPGEQSWAIVFDSVLKVAASYSVVGQVQTLVVDLKL